MSEPTYSTVADLLAVPERWTKGVLARDVDGQPRHGDSTRAVCWCVYGALQKVYVGSGRYDQARRKIAAAAGVKAHLLGDWNDRVDYATMVAAVRKAGV